MAQRMKLPARLRSVLRIRRRRLVVAVVLAAGVGAWFWSLLPRALFLAVVFVIINELRRRRSLTNVGGRY